MVFTEKSVVPMSINFFVWLAESSDKGGSVESEVFDTRDCSPIESLTLFCQMRV